MKNFYSIFIGLISLFHLDKLFILKIWELPQGIQQFLPYVTGTAPATFQNSTPIVYTGTSGALMMRNTTTSSGYTGASGNGNVF